MGALKRLYHTLMANHLMRRMEKCHSQIAHDATLWAHHHEQAGHPRRSLSWWPVLLIAAAGVVCAILLYA